MDERIKQLEAQVATLTTLVADLRSGNTIPLAIDQALVGRGFTKNGLTITTGMTGIMRLVSGLLSVISPKTGSNTYFVALSSGGAVTTAVTFTNGVQTA